MTETVSARRAALIAAFSALALLVLIAAFDNQGTRTWRLDRITGTEDDTAHSWTAGPVQALSTFDWRATPASGEPARVFLGFLSAAVLAVLFTFLLVLLVCRGVAAGRGRWALFAGSWFATGAAAGLAVVAGSAVAGASLAIGAADPAGTRFARGDTYYQMLNAGLLFGLFAGWLVGLVAVVAYGITEDAHYADDADDDVAEEPASTSPYGYSYGYGYGSAAQSSPSAQTQPIVPPQDDDPYGGNRSY